jgi:FdhD protein
MTIDRSPAATSAPQHRARMEAVDVLQVRGNMRQRRPDRLAGEEPLLVRIAGSGQEPVEVATTMRTPGHEADLAVGLLFAEGLLDDAEVVDVTFADPHSAARPDDTVTVHLDRPVSVDAVVARRVAATAACGVCGRASIDDLLARCHPLPATEPVPWSVVSMVPDRLRDSQDVFAHTGGLHAAGIATAGGRLVTVREDVGRHNALDAAIGHHVRQGDLPLHGYLAVLSGRIGFELVQKAAVAGIPVVVAVGAASDLAVRTAEQARMCLVGFVRDGDGNVYTGEDRLDLGA